MKFTVELTRRAERDVIEISDWLSARSPAGAARWLLAFEEMLGRVSDAPLSFSRADEADAFNVTIRQIFFRTPKGREYRAVFIADEQHVKILCVRGPGQSPIEEADIRDV